MFKNSIRTLARAASLLVISVALVGCVATTRSIDTTSDFHYDASYDFADKKAIVNELTSSLLADARSNNFIDRPVVISYGIANETSEHINTGGIADDIRANLLQSKQFRFLNQRQRENLVNEADYQYAGFVAPEERLTEGRQLGADFLLSGTLRSIEKKQPKQWRLNKRKLVYYNMTLEMTDTTTGEITWTDNVEIARESSQPIIAW
jgi:penicillin-binding protein activator